jgi:hypothetical protein
VIEIKNLKKTFSQEKDAFPHQKHLREQSTNTLFMIKPLAFKTNKSSLEDNFFIKKEPIQGNSKAKALFEWTHLTELLLKEGITIHQYESLGHETPDAVFPNNWFSTHRNSNGTKTLCLYPLHLENRRKERKEEILNHLKIGYSKIEDLTFHEKDSPPLILEGTGSLILDRINQRAFASISKRTDLELAKYWAEKFKYKEIITFFSSKETPVYHTNVMMSLGTHFAIICLEAIENEEERNKVQKKIEIFRDIIPISKEQMNNFCGNVLEIKNSFDEHLLVMSTRAYQSFNDRQLKILSNHVKKFIHAPINTIEDLGGGGVRCMIAELF